MPLLVWQKECKSLKYAGASPRKKARATCCVFGCQGKRRIHMLCPPKEQFSSQSFRTMNAFLGKANERNIIPEEKKKDITFRRIILALQGL